MLENIYSFKFDSAPKTFEIINDGEDIFYLLENGNVGIFNIKKFEILFEKKEFLKKEEIINSELYLIDKVNYVIIQTKLGKIYLIKIDKEINIVKEKLLSKIGFINFEMKRSIFIKNKNEYINDELRNNKEFILYPVEDELIFNSWDFLEEKSNFQISLDEKYLKEICCFKWIELKETNSNYLIISQENNFLTIVNFSPVEKETNISVLMDKLKIQKSDGTYFYDMLVVVKCKDNDLFFQIFLATSLTTINIITFDISNKKIIDNLNICFSSSKPGIDHLFLSTNQRYLYFSTCSRYLKIYDFKKEKEIVSFSFHNNHINKIKEYSKIEIKKKFLITISDDNYLMFLNLSYLFKK